MLFLGYHREHPTLTFSQVWSGNQSIGDFWMNNHWAGTDKAQDKLELFNKSMVHKDSTEAIKAKKRRVNV